VITRAKRLREQFKNRPILRIVGAHNGLGAKLIERNGFDGIWSSGLEISTSHGVPDASILTMTENLLAAQAIHDATTLPVLCDCDTGYGNISNVIHMVRKYEASGLAAVVIEDKRFPKMNSFIPGRQELADQSEFAAKIEAAKNAQRDPDFMVLARVEALIAGWGLSEALRRARAYADAGADGIVIHSKAEKPDEVFAFAQEWDRDVPLIAIPTTYYRVKVDELARRGFRMVIYANHGLRASLKAMNETFRSIQEAGSTGPVEGSIASMEEVFEIQGMGAMREDERKFSKVDRPRAVIPAAGDHRAQSDLKEMLSDRPLCMIEIGGKTLIERQADLLRSCGIQEISIVGGYEHGKIKAPDARVLFNPDYQTCHIAHSVMAGMGESKQKSVMVYSDILFDRQIVSRLVESPHAITLVIDRAYQSLPDRAKKLELVSAVNPADQGSVRKLDLDHMRRLRRIGRGIPREEAQYEFIGMAFFRERGLADLREAWNQALEEYGDRPFYEAPHIRQASFTDLIQYLLDRKIPIFGMVIEHGWSEVHSLDDFRRIHAYYQSASKTSVPA